MTLRIQWPDAFFRLLPAPSRPRSGVAVAVGGHLGDFLEATPMLRRLREELPGERVVWLVGPWNRDTAARYADWFDDLWTFVPDSPTQWRGRPEWRPRLRDWLRVAVRLRRLAPRVLVATSMESPATRFLANAARPALWSGRGDRPPPRLARGIETRLRPYQKDCPESLEFLRLLEPLGIAAPAFWQRPVWNVSPGEAAEADALLSLGSADGSPAASPPLVVLSPGSGWPGKNWAPDRFSAVAARLRAAGCRVAWTGTAAEAALCPPDAPADARWFGSVSLPVLAAVLARAALWLGNDGGVMHLAAAVRCPTLSLWGPTNNSKWAPHGLRDRALRAAPSCPGCPYWDWRRSCLRTGHPCMDALSPDAVADAALDLLESAPT